MRPESRCFAGDAITAAFAGATHPEAAIFPLNPVLRDYEWGSHTAIPELLGLPATGAPMAELWLGAHPDSPAGLVLSDADSGDAEQPLDSWLAAHPRALGETARARFGDRLPYLLKVLAAEQALSLQVHPTNEQAAAGFAAEEAAGVPRGARERRYKDPNHKPEMVVALTPFEALCGLRPVPETLDLLEALPLDHPDLLRVRTLLDVAEPATGLRAVFEFALGGDLAGDAVEALAAACRRYVTEQPNGAYLTEAQTVLTLVETYPGDPGVLVALLLNRLTLAPGEALYLPAGNVHAYLHGTGVEVMATSDNVLRAGLTPKYVDVPELLSVIDFTPRPKPYVTGAAEVAGLVRYRPGAAEFELAWLTPTGDPVVVDEPGRTDPGPRLVFCLSGALEVTVGEAPARRLARADAVFVPADERELRVGGSGTAVVVAVPAG